MKYEFKISSFFYFLYLFLSYLFYLISIDFREIYFLKKKILFRFTFLDRLDTNDELFSNLKNLEKMPLEIKLYGDLKEKITYERINVGAPIILNMEDKSIKIVSDILKKLVIRESEISHIFVNGKYSELGRKVRNGDSVGLFPKRMALIFLEIAVDKYISVNIELEGDLKEYGPAESVIEIPKGSTVKSMLKKYKFSNKKNNLKIIVNGKSCYDKNFVLKDGDSVVIFQLNN